MERFSHDDLVEIGYKWMLKRCGVAFKELVTCPEVPDVIGFLSGHSFLVECKTSRADFLTDKKKGFRRNPEQGMGQFRFFLCPKDLIKVDELPTFWGLIEVNEKGKALVKHNPFGKGNIYSSWIGHTRNKEAETQMMYSALRRLQIHKCMDKIYTSP